MESHSSLAPLIDQPKGNYDENWHHGNCRYGLDKSGTICVVVKPVLLDRCVDKYLGVAVPWN